ncbi:hypothetical protein QCE48_11265 [Caballeronia sp. LZ024]|nr:MULTISPECIES: hypothetical protein [unclassified Caballeronia]MDR5751358.1 hypothetical protein [Caballeronia sp. LZ024]MDR5844500.1 hypothetical protein [Caballeronia sp. LZ031]
MQKEQLSYCPTNYVDALWEPREKRHRDWQNCAMAPLRRGCPSIMLESTQFDCGSRWTMKLGAFRQVLSIISYEHRQKQDSVLSMCKGSFSFGSPQQALALIEHLLT